MKVLIVGGAGMVGRKLAERLARDGTLGGKAISQLALYDVVAAEKPAGAKFPVEISTGDLPAAGETDKLVAGKPDVIFHLAAIVSGEAEQDFDKGYRINLAGTMNLLDSIRRAYDGAARKPRLVFTSSIAVFGAPFPEKIGDEFFTTPLTSYGTQKAIGELLLADYTRKGLLDGVGIRLPTICVRPGKPNKAASGFFSNIMREPLAGQEAVLPVSDDVMHWHASPRAAVGFLLHAATIDGETMGPRRNLSMPGVAVTVGGQIEALRKVAGEKVVKRIRREPDPFVQKIVAGWPRNFETKRAISLGFKADASFEEIVKIHIEDELKGKIA
ncbi:MAG TPA: SDR family oxidoreductase [Hyphomicrobiaceae bacterium]|nr:SDR family oxidoreductase [Hyphomicrobiaceae bacterium]